MITTSKICYRCKKDLSYSEFNRCNTSNDGHQAYCRTCHELSRKEWKRHLMQQNRQVPKIKNCRVCGKTKSTIEFHRDKNTKDGLQGPCKACDRAKRKKWEKRNPTYWKDYARKNRAKKSAATLRVYYKYRFETLAAYGNKCSCCGESEIKFLTLEHINHDGKQHRKLHKGPAGVYRDLKRRGFPKKGYTLLCWNCQEATRFRAVCPHKNRNAQQRTK